MSFGVELYRKSAKFRVIDTLAGAVVGVYERDDSFRDTVGTPVSNFCGKVSSEKFKNSVRYLEICNFSRL